ncbi:hypothetical protein STEG23_016068 [Scotinomys teguina]
MMDPGSWLAIRSSRNGKLQIWSTSISLADQGHVVEDLMGHSGCRIQDFELDHVNIYPTHDLLGHWKILVLGNHSCRISMTQGNSRISEKSFGEGPVLMVYQTNSNSLHNEHFQRPSQWNEVTHIQCVSSFLS